TVARRVPERGEGGTEAVAEDVRGDGRRARKPSTVMSARRSAMVDSLRIAAYWSGRTVGVRPRRRAAMFSEPVRAGCLTDSAVFSEPTATIVLETVHSLNRPTRATRRHGRPVAVGGGARCWATTRFARAEGVRHPL